MENKLLVVVDYQNDFVDGALGTSEAQAISENVANKIKQYQENNLSLAFTMDTHYENYLETQEGKNLPVEHCLITNNAKTRGWCLYDKLNVNLSQPYFMKNTFGSVSLVEYVKDNNFDEVELIGVCTGICVISNAILIKSFCPEVKITVDASCCACVTPESHLRALEAMKLLQINIINEMDVI